MTKKVSLKDVARHVGVSTALVSYVINHKEKEARVGSEMVLKIRKAVTELNYQPNLIAKSLKSGKTNTIGLIVADISNPFFSNISRIIEDEARKEGYIVIIGSSDEDAEKSQDLINVFFNRQVDAFIIAPAENTEFQIIELQKKNIPVVIIIGTQEMEKKASVIKDLRTGMQYPTEQSGIVQQVKQLRS